MQINAIQQRAGQFALIAFGFFTAVATTFFRITQITTGAWVHRRNQLEASREGELLGGAGNADFTGFQRFAQDLQYPSVEFR